MKKYNNIFNVNGKERKLYKKTKPMKKPLCLFTIVSTLVYKNNVRQTICGKSFN